MRKRVAYLTVALVCTLTGLCAAQNTTAATGVEQRLSDMEQILQKQNAELDLLRKQLSQQDEARLNKARSDEIRQMVKEILSDEEFRNEIYQPTLQAGYNHGFYIKSTDDSFYMKTRLRSQFRYYGIDRNDKNPNFTGNVDQNDINGFGFARLRLYFTGWLWDKDLKYTLVLEGASTTTEDYVTLKYGYFDYKYADNHSVRWGSFLPPFGRQNTHGSTCQQMFIECSMPTCVFTPGDSLGVQGYGELFNDRLSYEIGLFNGLGDGDDTVFQSDSKFAAAGRIVWHALEGYDESDETDMMFHEKPALDIGASFAYNQNDGDLEGRSLLYGVSDLIRAGRGGYAYASANGAEILQFGLEAGFKYRGFSISGEYFYRHTKSDHSWSDWSQLVGLDNTGNLHGAYLQAGYYIIPKKLDVNARVSSVWGGDDSASFEEAIGMNYYIKGHALKISADITHVDECAASSSTAGYSLNDDMWMYRLQVQATMD